MTTEQSALAAIVDGAALPPEQARELWKKFSDYMGVHKGDVAGFAKTSGFVRIVPDYRNGKAVLVAYTKEPPGLTFGASGRLQRLSPQTPRSAAPAKKKNKKR